MSRRKLAWRLYGLTAAIVVAVMIALIYVPRFVGSPRYLEPQAALVQNLVANALTYRRPDGRCSVEVRSDAGPEGVELRVIDNGPGIPPDRRAEALSPLTRLRTDLPGTGLGLATCSRIVAAHGGTLSLADSVGGGTTVSALLPA